MYVNFFGMETLVIGMCLMGSLLIILVAIGKKSSRQAQNQDEILECESRKQESEICINPLIFPVCDACNLNEVCEHRMKTKIGK